jgi:hypothetical protein
MFAGVRKAGRLSVINQQHVVTANVASYQYGIGDDESTTASNPTANNTKAIL